MRLGLPFSICLAAASVDVAAAQSLDGLIGFDDPYWCATNEPLSALLGGVIRWEQAGDNYKGSVATPPAPDAFARQVGNPALTVQGDEYRVTLPLRGTWRGLPVRSLVIVEQAESEGGFYLVFDAPKEQVHSVANEAGFRIPRSGSEYRDGGVMGVSVGVETYGGTGALYCFDG